MQGTHEELRGLALGTALDPVCGMSVPETSRHRFRVGEVEYRFCSAHCRERFAKQPEAFLEPDATR